MRRTGLYNRAYVRIVLLGAIALSCSPARSLGAEETFLLNATPDFPGVIRSHAERLTKAASDNDAIDLFVSTIGPALQLGDLAKTVEAKGLPAKLAKELLVPEITAVATRLIADLAAWNLATALRQAVRDNQLNSTIAGLTGQPVRRDWLGQRGTGQWLDSLTRVFEGLPSGETNSTETPASTLMTLTERAAQLETEAIQATYRDWDRLHGWKDRVRLLRGQYRLCGTWQWVVHNHQRHHQEQKLSLLFPPPGHDKTGVSGLAETIVLGDNVYLRWEIDGRVQEDSLQFTKEGQRLEGTFVNSQGGWGSISGKRTASCAP